MTQQISLHCLRHFQQLQDPRRDHPTKLHSLFDLLSITLFASLCGAEDWVEIEMWANTHHHWLRTFLALPNGIPSHDTFGRVFALLDPSPLSQAFLLWSRELAGRVKGVVALDGKTVRRSLDSTNGRGPIHVVSAFAAENHVVLAQLKVDEKSNEITALPELIRLLDLEDCIVTIDAMGCQVEIAQTICDQKGDYVLCVKENQPELHREIKELFEMQEKPNLPMDQQIEKVENRDVDKGHGRIEQRRCVGIEDLEGLSAIKRWPRLMSIWMVESEREEIRGKTSTEKRYYISSLKAESERDAEIAQGAVRGHWGIENQVHWVLDVCMREDEKRARKGNSAENLTIIRKIVLNLLKKDKTIKVGLKAKLKRAGWDKNYLLHILGLT